MHGRRQSTEPFSKLLALLALLALPALLALLALLAVRALRALRALLAAAWLAVPAADCSSGRRPRALRQLDGFVISGPPRCQHLVFTNNL